MLLYKDGLIELNYEVTNDILVMNWPDLSGFTMPEIHYSIRKIIDTLRHYDIKNLLVDSRSSRITELSFEDYQKVLVEFVKQLMTTRLRKLARISTGDATREIIIDETAEMALNKMGIQFIFRNFKERPSAVAWLSETES